MAGLRISRSKRITFDIKVTIKISCLMDFSDYPFDEHSCNFQVSTQDLLIPIAIFTIIICALCLAVLLGQHSFQSQFHFPHGVLAGWQLESNKTTLTVTKGLDCVCLQLGTLPE